MADPRGEAAGDALRVVMLGPARNVRGGVSAVVNAILEDERMNAERIAELLHQFDIIQSIDIDPCDRRRILEWKTVLDILRHKLPNVSLVIIYHRYLYLLVVGIPCIDKGSRRHAGFFPSFSDQSRHCSHLLLRSAYITLTEAPLHLLPIAAHWRFRCTAA